MTGTDMVPDHRPEGRVDLRELDTAVRRTLERTPGFSGMTYTYMREVAVFVKNDVIGKSPRETIYLPGPASYYFISQALQKLPLFCVLTEVCFDRLVSHMVIQGIEEGKARIERERKIEERKQNSGFQSSSSHTNHHSQSGYTAVGTRQ